MTTSLIAYDDELQALCETVRDRQMGDCELGGVLLDFLVQTPSLNYDPETFDPMSSTLLGTIQVLGQWLCNIRNHSNELKTYLSHRSGIDRVRDIIFANDKSPHNTYDDFVSYLNEPEDMELDDERTTE